MLHARLVADAICVVLCVAAAVIDLKKRRIPDVLTYSGVALGLLLAGLGGGYDLAAAATAVVLLGGLFAFFAAVGAGAGDAKLMAGGALLGWPWPPGPSCSTPWGCTALAGGALAVVVSIRQRRLGAALKGIATMAKRRRVDRAGGSGVAIPYGLAIAIGTVWAVVGRYVPAILVG